MFNIAANLRPNDMSGAVNRGVAQGQQIKANKQAYEFGEMKKDSYLYEFGKQKKVDKAREAYFGAESPEEQQKATAMLMAHDPEFLQGMADQQRKAAEADDKKAAATGKAYKELAPVMMEHTKALKQIPAEARTDYVKQNLAAVLQSAPQSVRGQLEQGLQQKLADGKIDDAELDELEKVWSPFIEQEKDSPTNWQFKTTQDGTIKAFDPRNPGATPVDTGESARDPKGGQIIKDSEGNVIYASGADGIAAAGTVSSTKSTTSNLQKDIGAQKVLLSDMEDIGTMFDESLLGYGANISKWWADKKDKTGTLDPQSDEAEFFRNKSRFDGAVNQFFNSYRKEITGSAAAVQEMRDLKNSIISVDDGPEGFKVKLDQMQGKAKRAMRIKMSLMRDGYNAQDKDFGAELDARYTSGFEDDPEAQFEFMTNQMGMSEAAAVAQMESLGYE